MYVSQHDMAQVDDNTVKRLAIEAMTGDHGRLAPLWHAFGAALIRAQRQRARILAVVELDLLEDDDAEGGIVGPDDDPIAEALRELRGDCP